MIQSGNLSFTRDTVWELEFYKRYSLGTGVLTSDTVWELEF